MNRQLERQMRRLELDPATAPTVEQWAAFVARMEAAYDDRERERYLSSRSSRLASAELSEATRNAERTSAELRTVIDALDEGVLLVDAVGQINSANPAARSILGSDPVGESADQLFAGLRDHRSGGDESDPECACRRLTSAIADGRSLEIEHAVLGNTDDRAFHLSVRVRPIPEQGITVVAINDITSVIEAEANRIGLERRIGHQHRLESIGRLAGSVAHDFNNVLAGILACVELLEDDVTEESLADVAEIRRSARRGADLTRRLLAFSRHEADEPEVVDLNGVVDDLSTLLDRMLAGRATLDLELSPRACDILIDPLDLEQIVMNLVVNARDAVGTDGKIVIETRRVDIDEAMACSLLITEGAYVVLTVVDNGSGMDAATVARAPEPFFTTKAHGAGHGLGLATVHGLVSNAGGALTLQSALGVGTTATLHLPAVVEMAVVG